MIRRIVSGGQTGVDRAALDVAIELGIPCGGWCPRGRKAEDGPIDARYPLEETPSAAYTKRTEWNVRDSDATLILARLPLGGGTALTERLARKARRPVLVIDPWAQDPQELASWLEDGGYEILNVAGPRESRAPGVYEAAVAFLETALTVDG